MFTLIRLNFHRQKITFLENYMKQIYLVLFGFICFVGMSNAQSAASENEEYLSWTMAQAENIGRAMRQSGKVGSSWDGRLLDTDRAINYKLRATLLTPEVIRACARLEQLRNRLTDEQTRKLVKEAEESGDIIVMVELDPNEGSGVIPLDWRVFLQSPGARADSGGAVAGIKSPQLRNMKVLSGVFQRDYDYDVFWVVFPVVDEKGNALFAADVSRLELLVGIYKKEGRVIWNIPESIRQKIKERTRK
jgi:hypothetical protein